MIIYKNTVSGFGNDVIDSSIEDKIERNLRAHGIGSSNSEKDSWRLSTLNMKLVLDLTSIPGDTDVFIEYNVPFTNSRIDFCISGLDSNSKGTAIIIEMKGWSKGIRESDIEGMVHADFYHGETLHPSYQAWSYANYITNFNSEVVDGQIDIIPCASLYNYPFEQGEVILEAEPYEYYTGKARIFYKNDKKEFARFLDERIKFSDGGVTMNRIESGKLTVSASLQKSLRRVLKEKDFFAPMEGQVLIYNTLLAGIRNAFKKRKKTVFIVRGGPGTGKSVMALKLLSQLNGGFGDSDDEPDSFIHTFYVTKTSAPRATYSKELRRLAKEVGVNCLFKGASDFVNSERNEYPALLVDEAHRLTTRSSQFVKGGKDQVAEIINAALASVFFIDEDQNVSMTDIGTIDKIVECAYAAGAEVVSRGLALETQFRCRGSGLYISWVDDVLGIRKSKDLELLGALPYEIEVVDTPEELMSVIAERRAQGFNSRIVAGYCWDWTTKDDPKAATDISFDNSDLKLRWNKSTDTWGNDEKCFEEIGCIHSSQGLEYQYGGVIIGDDMRFEDGRVVTHPEARSDQNGTMRGWKKNPERADRVIRNTYRTLMTRGMYGCYVYCTDKALSDYIKSRLEQFR